MSAINYPIDITFNGSGSVNFQILDFNTHPNSFKIDEKTEHFKNRKMFYKPICKI